MKMNKSEDTDKIADRKVASLYILGDRVTFYVSEALLRGENPDQEIRLQRPASRCLEILIRRQGGLITQNELMAYGWGEERARFITPNAFYQSMHHLRQSMARVGLPDTIHTVARQGTGLSEALHIQPVSEVPEQTWDSALFRGNPRLIPAGVCAFAAILLSTSLYWLWPAVRSDTYDLLGSYTQEVRQACRLYVSPGSPGTSKVSFLLERAGISCQKPVTAIVTIAKYGTRNSVMACTGAGAGLSDCRVYFIMDSDDEKIRN